MPAIGRRRTLEALSLVALLAATSSCGGGGGGAGGSDVPLAGRVAARDGASSDLAGVQVTLVETGASEVTGADGSFAFSCPTGGLHLRFLDPLAPTPLRIAAVVNPDDCPLPADGSGIPWPDTENIDGDEVWLGDVVEPIDVEVELDAGAVSSLKATRGAATGSPEEQGLVGLSDVDGSGAVGTVSLHHNFPAGFSLEIEAWGLPASSYTELVLTDAHGHQDVAGGVTSDCGATRMTLLFGYSPTDGTEDDPTGRSLLIRVTGGADIVVGTVPPAGVD